MRKIISQIKINKIDKVNLDRLLLYKNIVEDSYNNYNSCLELVENEFIVFKSIYDILYLIYTKVDKKEDIKSIIIYNLLDNARVSEIRKKGIENIKCIKYCKDNTNKRDLILVFYFYAGIKLWDVNNLDNILTISGRNNTFFLIIHAL